MTSGTDRFRLAGLDDSKPYLQGVVDFLPDQAGDEMTASNAARAVQAAFRSYLSALTARGATQLAVPELPDDPVLLSYLVAASMIIDLSGKQALLAEPDAASRLAAERTLLSRETTMLRSLTSTPAPDMRYSPYNPN